MRSSLPPDLQPKVLIVDYDVHHGNGTQELFIDNPNVLFFSIHGYAPGRFYPHSGHESECGTGGGVGKNINMNLLENDYGFGYGDREYMETWERLLLPVLRAFDPALVVISAGFDAVDGDSLGLMVFLEFSLLE